MSGEPNGLEVDRLLLPLIDARDDTELAAATDRLISTDTLPIVSRIINAKLRTAVLDSRDAQETSELQGDVVVRLLARLNECRADPRAHPINNWRNYVTGTTYHACYEYFRQKYPRRHSLKNKIRYLLGHRSDFAIWQTDDGEFLCGRASWRDRNDVSSDRLRLLLDNPPAGLSASAGRSPADLGRLIDELLTAIAGAVTLDDLVAAVAQLWQIKDQGLASIDDPYVAVSVTASQDLYLDPSRRISDQENLRLLWAEIRELPLPQRTALLLNLKDDIMLLTVTGVASIREIAAVLERKPAEFALMWPNLPFDDAAIAAELGVTRQQVINLRKSARARLGRKMKILDGNIALG